MEEKVYHANVKSKHNLIHGFLEYNNTPEEEACMAIYVNNNGIELLVGKDKMQIVEHIKLFHREK